MSTQNIYKDMSKEDLQQLMSIMTNGTGGFGIDQTIASLKQTFKDNSSVLVLDGHESNQEANLAKLMETKFPKEKRFLVFPYAFNSEHQIGIVIDRQMQQIRIYDHNETTRNDAFQSDDNLVHVNLKRIVQNLNGSNPNSHFEVVNGFKHSPYPKQKGDWECGVLAVLALEHDVEKHQSNLLNQKYTEVKSKVQPNLEQAAKRIYLNSKESIGQDTDEQQVQLTDKIENLHRIYTPLKEKLACLNINLSKVLKLVEKTYKVNKSPLELLQSNQLKISDYYKKKMLEDGITLLKENKKTTKEYVDSLMRFSELYFKEYLVDVNQDAFSGDRKDCFRVWLDKQRALMGESEDFASFMDDLTIYMANMILDDEDTRTAKLQQFPPERYDACFSGMSRYLHANMSGQSSYNPKSFIDKVLISAHQQFVSVKVGDISPNIHLPGKIEAVLGVDESLIKKVDSAALSVNLEANQIRDIISEYPGLLKEYALEYVLSRLASRLREFDPFQPFGAYAEFKKIVKEFDLSSNPDDFGMDKIYDIQFNDEDFTIEKAKLNIDKLAEIITNRLNFSGYELLPDEKLSLDFQKREELSHFASLVNGNKLLEFVDMMNEKYQLNLENIQIDESLFRDIRKYDIIRDAKILLKQAKPYVDYLQNRKELPENIDELLDLMKVLCQAGGEKKLIVSIVNKIKSQERINYINEQDETMLHYAAAYGDVEICKLCINDTNLNKLDKNGNSPLILALQRCHSELSNFLISHEKTNFNVKNSDGLTPLALAISNNDRTIVNKLIKRGVDIDQLYTDPKDHFRRERSPLAMAINNNNNPNLVDILLGNTEQIDLRDHDDDPTALHLALQKGDFKLFKKILEKNPDVDIEVNGQNILHAAIIKNRTEFVEELIGHKQVDINKKNKHDLTPLTLAAKYGNFEILTILINKGEKVSSVDPLLNTSGPDVNNKFVKLWNQYNKEDLKEYKENLLAHVAAKCSSECYKLVREMFPENEVSLNKVYQKNDKGGNESHIVSLAAANPDPSVLTEMINERRLNVNLKNSRGDLPVHTAIKEQSNTKALELLLSKANLEIYATDSDGNSPLVLAAKKNNFNFINKILEHATGFDENTINDALEVAGKNKNPDVLKKLIDFVQIKLEDKDKHTVFTQAILSKNFNIESLKKLIETKKINPNFVFYDSTVLMKIVSLDLTQSEKTELIELVLNNSPNINLASIINQQGSALLECARRDGQIELFNYLVDKIFTVTNKIDIWYEPLINAIYSNQEKIQHSVLSHLVASPTTKEEILLILLRLDKKMFEQYAPKFKSFLNKHRYDIYLGESGGLINKMLNKMSNTPDNSTRTWRQTLLHAHSIGVTLEKPPGSNKLSEINNKNDDSFRKKAVYESIKSYKGIIGDFISKLVSLPEDSEFMTKFPLAKVFKRINALKNIGSENHEEFQNAIIFILKAIMTPSSEKVGFCENDCTKSFLESFNENEFDQSIEKVIRDYFDLNDEKHLTSEIIKGKREKIEETCNKIINNGLKFSVVTNINVSSK